MLWLHSTALYSRVICTVACSECCVNKYRTVIDFISRPFKMDTRDDRMKSINATYKISSKMTDNSYEFWEMWATCHEMK